MLVLCQPFYDSYKHMKYLREREREREKEREKERERVYKLKDINNSVQLHSIELKYVFCILNVLHMGI